MSTLETDITYLPGVGPRRAEPLKKAGVQTPADLLRYYPRRYLDRSSITPIRSLNVGETATVVGRVVAAGAVSGRAGRSRFELRLQDDSGSSIKAVWFRGAAWIQRLFKVGERLALHGKVDKFGGTFSMAHPDFDKLDSESAALDTGRIIPLYPGGSALERVGLNSRTFRRLIYQTIKEHGLEIPEILPASVRERGGLIDGRVALRAIHFPKNHPELQAAQRRLKFEELFFLQLFLALLHERRQQFPGPRFHPPGDHARRFIEEVLPFELTSAQVAAIDDITQDTMTGRQMNRLLQGDVGSGKTVVAVAAMMQALDSGFQSAFMAPTELLAEQHFSNLKRFFEPLEIPVHWLIGGQRKAWREEILADLAEGRVPVVVGTHAIIQEKVEFKNLGLAVVDEQHRFGVEQRAAMFEKGDRPHVLLMTATPIPRSLAMTLYGDLDVTLMKERPAGRKPIVTRLYSEKQREEAYEFIKLQLREGRQAYVVYPLVEESEKVDLKDAESGYQNLVARLRPYRVDLVHGRMAPYEKDEAMHRFKNGETDLLVATTVIEVGVDVPNATVMMIEHAERFGLTQLHQLRGRVGRGGAESFCLLMADYKRTDEARERLEAMLKTDDGFEISEIDLRLRGAGDILGTRQSGLAEFKLADLVKDQDLLLCAREIAFEIAERDPGLDLPEHATVRRHIAHHAPDSIGFARVG
jgi:ATP-dependent DNA helicase RecG